ncbi:helix-turn-helix domain-containing protein [Ancylobacter sp. FA202]|uniref:helix-turn-helix domain-containing protein n=1 Tax=Ancylobacter sp. FA202 TaxID=1111106 RepID=UPI0003770EC4|nr:helix-turn-helix domain-containing protein [Ancylobacter sp. FA202]
MSVEAMAWAKRQQTGSMGAKSVLRALADYADEDGCCWPSRRQIADDTEMAPGSVSRHLAALEAGRLIAREERLRDNGSRSTDMIRLMMKPAAGGSPPSSNWRGPPPQIEEAPSSVSGSAPPQIEEAHNYHPNHHLKEESPQAPQGAGAGDLNSDGEGEQEASPAETLDTQADALWTTLAPDPAASKVKFLRAWSRLPPADRAGALTMAARYVDHCRTVKRRICDPATYLSERRWERFASLPAPAKAEAVRPVETDPVARAVLWAINGERGEQWTFVEEGTDAWREWHAAFVAAGYGHRFSSGTRKMAQLADGTWGRLAGRSFPLRYPPKPGAGPPGGAAADGRAEQGIGG